MKKVVKVLMLVVFLISVSLLLENKVFGNDLSEVIVYPNPFNVSKGHTTITFKNLTTDDVVIKIYKITGELVKTIKVQNAQGQLTWDVTNDAEKQLGSGAYIYLITNSAGQKAVGKIAVIK